MDRKRRYSEPGVVLFYQQLERDPVTGQVTETNYEGFSANSGARFVFNKSLKGASVSMEVPLYGWRCVYTPQDPGEPHGITQLDEIDDDPVCEELDRATVEVDVRWTGVGEIYRDQHRNAFDEGHRTRFHNHAVVAIRDARLTGQVSGSGLELARGDADLGVLLRGKYHEHFTSAP